MQKKTGFLLAMLALMFVSVGVCDMHAQDGVKVLPKAISVDETVSEYTLVKVATDVVGDDFDLLIMSVVNNRIMFVDAVEVKNPPGDAAAAWVFTGPPGSYAIRMTVWSKEQGRLDVSTAYITIEGDAPDDPDDPDDPDPPSGFESQVKSALKKVGSDGTQYTGSVADVYQEIASSAKSQPNAWGPAAMVNEAKVRNATVIPVSAMDDWQPFFADLATAMRGLGLEADDLDGHIQAFETIAKVLREG
jgi:hypothetical protein